MSDVINQPVEITGESIELLPDNNFIHVGCTRFTFVPIGGIIPTLCGQHIRKTNIPYKVWSEVPDNLRCVVCQELTVTNNAGGFKSCAVTGTCQQPNTCDALKRLSM